MIKLRCVNDSRGHKSWSWTLALPALVGISAWFLAGGIDVTIAGVRVVTATKSGIEYAAAITPWLAFLGHREMTEKKYANGNGNGGTAALVK